MKTLLVTLTPSESKRLIAKAVPSVPAVQTAMKKGKIYISQGTTCAMVAEELLGISLDISHYLCGTVTLGRTCRTPDNRTPSLQLIDGKPIDQSALKDLPDEEVRRIAASFYDDYGPDDIFIKGANAIDANGHVGFLLGNKTGGGILAFAHVHAARKSKLVVPVGLEKFVPSVPDASRSVRGLYGYDYSFGRGCGYFSVDDAIVVTEIEAIRLLFDVKATLVASGGVGGSEGAVVLSCEGEDDNVKHLYRCLKDEVKGEPPISAWKMDCKTCEKFCNYPFKPE